MSHHGIKGGYTLPRDPRYISVFDVIKARQGSRWSSLRNEHRQRTGTVPGYRPLRMVSQVVEEMLRGLTIADMQDIEEKASSPAGLSQDASSVRASQLDDQATRSQ